MKKFILALALLFGLCAHAEAGVSCSVPFNLTNGTTADASQVMANYNAILSCLANNTAASGQNTDITALLGLTLPITPLCGATGYTVVNDAVSPNSVLDVKAAVAAMITTNGLSVSRLGVNLQLNFAINGANGLDTGTFAASTVYYVWLIDNGTTPAALASLSSTAPTMPSGYTYKCRLSADYSDSSTHLGSIVTLGDTTEITGTPPFSNGTVTGTCNSSFTAVTFGIPSTAIYALGKVAVTGANSAAYVARSTTTGTITGLTLGSGGSPAATNYFQAAITPGAAGTVYYCSNSTNNVMNVFGWKDAVLAH